MQILFFEDAWERTISDQDHEKITDTFNQLDIRAGVSLTYLWDATNHEENLLVTTIIHNNREESLVLENIPIQYKKWCQTFTVPITIPAHHSMPWTFIFAKNTVTPVSEESYKINIQT